MKTMDVELGDTVYVDMQDGWSGFGVVTRTFLSGDIRIEKREGGSWLVDNGRYKKQSKHSLMHKIGTMFKKLVDSDTVALREVHFINGDLELTDEGRAALMEIVFDQNKAALVAVAKTQIEAAQKDA